RPHEERRLVLRRRQPRRGGEAHGGGVEPQAGRRGEVLRLLSQERVLRSLRPDIEGKDDRAARGVEDVGRRPVARQYRAPRAAGRRGARGWLAPPFQDCQRRACRGDPVTTDREYWIARSSPRASGTVCANHAAFSNVARVTVAARWSRRRRAARVACGPKSN